MAFNFDQIFAADPANPSNIAQNASIKIFAPGDATKTALSITDTSGTPLPNPIPVNANGFGPAFAHATLDRVAWEGGGFTGFFTSYEGMKQVALDAQAAAENAATTAGTEAAAVADAAVASVIADADAAAASAATAATNAASSATAAANAAALVGAPADTAIAAVVNNGASATKAALTSTFVPKWKATTAYAAGDKVLSPSGDVVSAKTSFTSGASYNAANWDLSTSYATPAAVGYGTKVGGFSFGGGGGASSITSISEMIVRIPFRLPVKPTRARLHIWNRNFKDNLGLTAGAFSFTGVWLGKPVVDSVGALTSNFQAAPTKLLDPFSTPADGSEYISAWFDVSALIDPKTDYALSYGYTCAAGQTTHRATGFHWWSNITGDAAKAGNQNMVGTVTTNQSPHLDMWVEYEFAATNPVNLYVGDSLTDGQRALYGTRDSYPQQHSRRTGAVAVVLAFSGSSLSPGWDITSPKYLKYPGMTFNAMYVHLGTNDINAGADLATVQARLGVALGKLRSTYGALLPVYLGIVPPRNFAAGPEAVRVAYNTWLRTLPFGASGTMDFDRAVRSSSNLAVIDPDFDGGDGTHMSTGGYDKFAQAVPLRVSVS